MVKTLPLEVYEIAETMENRFWVKYVGMGFGGHYLAADRAAAGLGSEDIRPDRKFPTAEALRVACYQWLVWMEANPLYEEKVFAYQGDLTTHNSPKKRVLTKASLLAWLKASAPSWDTRWPSYGEDYSAVRDEIELMIYYDKFEGASAGLYNSSIISSDLGLTSRVSAEINANVNNKRTTAEMTDAELKRELEARGIPLDMLSALNPSLELELEVPVEGVGRNAEEEGGEEE